MTQGQGRGGGGLRWQVLALTTGDPAYKGWPVTPLFVVEVLVLDTPAHRGTGRWEDRPGG